MFTSNIPYPADLIINQANLQRTLESTPNSGNTMARFTLCMDEAAAQETKRLKKEQEKLRTDARKVDRVEMSEKDSGINENDPKSNVVEMKRKPRHESTSDEVKSFFMDPYLGHSIDFSA
ncbi:MAG: hypothetical protein K6A69_07810 [Lachnospiraceae bacterium]|nr:hypothetical protein [Lachnospiraceae bacterium]